MKVSLKVYISTILLFGGIKSDAQITQSSENKTVNKPADTTKSCCTTAIPNRYKSNSNSIAPEGMVWIPGGTFSMGGDNNQARQDEFPKHSVELNGFFMDATEVTNSQFTKFVAATGYVTTAEKDIDWEEIKKQMPADTPKPDAQTLKAASLVFMPTVGEVNLQDYSQLFFVPDPNLSS